MFDVASGLFGTWFWLRRTRGLTFRFGWQVPAWLG